MREYVQELFRKLARVETKFHDVVHKVAQEVVSDRVRLQGIQLIVCTGTPIELVTWIVLLHFSHLFFATVQRRRKKSGRSKFKERRAKAGSRRRYRAPLLVVLTYSNLETAQGMEEALRQLAEVNQQTLQGIQTLEEEIRNSAASGSQREAGLTQAVQQTVATVQEGAKCISTNSTHCSPADSSDHYGGDRSKLRELRQGKEAWRSQASQANQSP